MIEIVNSTGTTKKSPVVGNERVQTYSKSQANRPKNNFIIHTASEIEFKNDYLKQNFD